ncbi:hypothetical protein B0H10DRAFT_2208598 [Mycena sp. CBHHK59/15]|nr:hypothetical protein B0H10DRAFT_2208598 [Mycena sp. CBHHK59/15]
MESAVQSCSGSQQTVLILHTVPTGEATQLAVVQADGDRIFRNCILIYEYSSNLGKRGTILNVYAPGAVKGPQTQMTMTKKNLTVDDITGLVSMLASKESGFIMGTSRYCEQNFLPTGGDACWTINGGRVFD